MPWLISYGSCSSLRQRVGVGVPALVGLLGLVLVAAAPYLPGSAVRLVAAGSGDDGAAELSQQFRDGDGDEPELGGVGIAGTSAGDSDGEEGVGERGDHGPAVPGSPGGDLTAVEPGGLWRCRLVYLSGPSQGLAGPDQIEHRRESTVALVAELPTAPQNFREIAELLRAGTILVPTEVEYNKVVERGLGKKAPFSSGKNSVADAVLIELYATQLRQHSPDDVYCFITSNHKISRCRTATTGDRTRTWLTSFLMTIRGTGIR